MRGMKGVRGLLLLAGLLGAAPALAGTLYRCDAPDGSRSYTSKAQKGARCVAISYTSGPARRAPAKPPVAAGATTTPAPVAGSPVAASLPAAATTAAAPPAAQAKPAAGSPPRRVVSGQVYAYIQDGVRHYTSKRPRGGAINGLRTIRYSYMETCYACAARPGVDFRHLRLNTDAYRAEIARAAKEYGVDEAVVRAIIHAESSFNPNALSRVGAQGLMQLMPATARRFGVTDAFDASQNIRGGVQYLAWLLKRFNGDLTLAAAGYNAGEGAVDRYGGVPPYSETQRYVQRVGVLAERYRGTLAAR
ncbi:MAG TPA: lytic transglycosylase domain-containing protein [Xanthomonadaceae bacterium]|nr:lytic transglycosylase domain-containing protein [Xanthomonadaceae bacterium]